VPDGIDNCPEKANTDQADADHDGVGDACDLQTCGNGVVQLAEQCDDGNLVDGDGCDSNCRVTRCGNGIKTAGEACDDGNLIAGDGCSPACLVGPVLADADGDLVPNSLDNCPYKPNAAQTDSGGINTAVPDGIGDACQCGDTNNSGTVTSTDVTVLKRALAGLSPAFSVPGLGVGLGKCNVAATATPGAAGCTATDATVISRALAGLSPGIFQGCDAAAP
jgi:cysteine-rich repeat protein